jgi:enamine deaminase RidA (YjgF/YER057c/UK114 family)
MIRSKLESLGVTLAKSAATFGAYVPAKRVGKLIYTAGQLPMKDGKLMATGPLPSSTSVESAQAAAKQCVINALNAVENLCGVDELVGVVRVGAFVLSDDGFDKQPAVANAASEFLIEIFGDAGRHVRAAVGTNALPLGASVEIEFIFETR